MTACARHVAVPALLHRPAPDVAPALIGWELHAHGVRARIVETEAYQGEDDRACHASRGRTPRAQVLWAAPGTLYCYLCYGMHVLLNLVCDHPGRPAAVLVRAVEVMDGWPLACRRRDQRPRDPRTLANGPGKVAQVFDLRLSANGRVLGGRGCPLTLRPPTRPPVALRCGARVGVDYAGTPWAAMPWRWWEVGFPVVGVPSRAAASSTG